MRLLVVGAERVDAGKTTFSVGLVDRLDGLGVKPRAGNDYWFDHDDYRTAIAEGRLYGKDARRLAAASAADVDAEDVNPIHRLWRPAEGPDPGLVGESHREFVLDRAGDDFVVNAAADVPDSARDALPVAEAPSVASVEELNALTRDRYLPALDALADRIADHDRAVVESYADVALPHRDLSVDAVAAVEPGRARIYDGDRWTTACEVASGSPTSGPGTGRLEQRVEDVAGHLDPEAAVSLPPLESEDREDPAAVADAYEVAYDALLAAAVE